MIQVSERYPNKYAVIGFSERKVLTIYIGEQNITHIKSKHLEDYNKYLEEILNKPDYIAVNPKDTSLEYVKEFF